VVDPGEILSELRLRKEPVEIACIRRAADVTVEAFRDMAAAVAPGVGERELEALVDARFRSAGGDGPGFATIVGSGANACVLHYVANRDRLEAGDLVLVDAGAELDYYTADITRTLPVSGAFSAEQRAVYEVVWQAHEAALGAARPGAAVSDIHHAAVGVIVEGLRDLGLLDGPVEQIVDEEAYRRFYPHQTSHWLGLDVHDPGDYTRADVSRSLEEGMVLTVEPGLYFHPRLGEIAGRWAGIGVRIEDDVLITAEGHECLTGGLPTDPGGVSALVGSRAGS
jgi:Xaa-Pro aminopeptidase